MAIRQSALRETIQIFGRTITGPPDRYNEPTVIELPAVSIKAAVQPVGAAGGVGSSIEIENSRDTRITRYVFMVGPDAPVDGIDRVVWRSRSFEVIGEPRVLTNGASVHHIEFTGQEILG